MIKRFFCIFIVLITVFSFSLISSAETVENEIFSISAYEMYSYLNENSTFRSYFDSLEYENNSLKFKLNPSYPKIGININSMLNLGLLDSEVLYKFSLGGNGCHIYIRTYDNIYTDYSDNIIYVQNVRTVSVNFLQNGDFQYFEGFSLIESPDIPPDSGIVGDSSDFHNFIVPFVSNLAIQTWDVFSSNWWALAFILMPLAYLLIISFIKLFSYFLFKFSPKYRIRYLNKYKNNYKVNFKDKYAPDFGHLSIFSFIKKKKHNKNNNDFKRFVYVDGVKYYRSNSNLKKIHTFKKDIFVEKTKYHNKKYDVDIDVEDS